MKDEKAGIWVDFKPGLRLCIRPFSKEGTSPDGNIDADVLFPEAAAVRRKGEPLIIGARELRKMFRHCLVALERDGNVIELDASDKDELFDSGRDGIKAFVLPIVVGTLQVSLGEWHGLPGGGRLRIRRYFGELLLREKKTDSDLKKMFSYCLQEYRTKDGESIELDGEGQRPSLSDKKRCRAVCSRRRRCRSAGLRCRPAGLRRNVQDAFRLIEQLGKEQSRAE